MSDIAKRLEASIRFDAINGDAHERNVCKRQMAEAVAEINRLTKDLQDERQARERAEGELAELMGLQDTPLRDGQPIDADLYTKASKKFGQWRRRILEAFAYEVMQANSQQRRELERLRGVERALKEIAALDAGDLRNRGVSVGDRAQSIATNALNGQEADHDDAE